MTRFFELSLLSSSVVLSGKLKRKLRLAMLLWRFMTLVADTFSWIFCVESLESRIKVFAPSKFITRKTIYMENLKEFLRLLNGLDWMKENFLMSSNYHELWLYERQFLKCKKTVFSCSYHRWHRYFATYENILKPLVSWLKREKMPRKHKYFYC